MTFLALLSEVFAIDLKCSFETKSWGYTYASNGYGCTVQNLVVTKPEIVTSINGQPASYYANQNVAVIYINSQTMNFLPSGIGKFFPNIFGMEISSSKLKYLEKIDMEQFRKLQDFHLSSNEIDSLHGDTFDNNPDIKCLHISSNQVKFIGANLLHPLTQLTTVSITEACATGGSGRSAIIAQIKNCPQPTTKLNRGKSMSNDECQSNTDGNFDAATKYMYLLSKKLESYEKLKKLYILADLVEAQNVQMKCTTGSDKTDTCNADGLKVKFVNSKLNDVKDEAGNKTQPETFKKLNIERQQTLFLPINLAEYFQDLTELSVISSGLFDINENVFDGMTMLNSLNLTGNKLYEITSGTFKDLHNLIVLDLSFNRLENVEIGAFESLEKLQKLKLNDNYLITIVGEAFENLKALKDLFLHNNELKFIDSSILTVSTHLATADFANNLCINMTHPGETLKSLETKIVTDCVAPIELKCDFEQNQNAGYMCKAIDLTVSRKMTKISKVQGVLEAKYDDSKVVVEFIVLGQSTKYLPSQISQSFANLERINIERSELTAIQKHDFEGLSRLKEIVIRFNNLSSIEDGAFDDVAQLELLDLSSNDILTLPSYIFADLTNLKTLNLSNNLLERLSADLLTAKNKIQKFYAHNNRLEVIETKFIKFLRKSAVVDLTGNDCTSLLYDESSPKSKTFFDFYGAVILYCSDD